MRVPIFNLKDWSSCRSLIAVLLLILAASSGPASAQNSFKALVAQFDKAYDSGNHETSLKVAKRMVAFARKRHGKRHHNYGLSLNYLAVASANVGQFADAVRHYQASLRVMEKTLGRNHLGIADLLNNLGIAHDNLGQSAQSVLRYKRALKIYDNKLKSGHASIANTVANLSNAYFRLGRVRDALPVAERHLEITEKANGSQNRLTGLARERVAEILHRLGRFDEAISLFEAALATYEATEGAKSQYVANTYGNLANVNKDMGRYNEAIALMEQSRDIFVEAAGPNHQNVGNTLNNLANIHKSLNQYGKAIALYKQALEIYDVSIGKEHVAVGNTLDNLAISYSDQGRLNEAMPLFERALAIKEKALGPQHPSVANTRNNFADALRKQGEHKRALQLFAKVQKVYEQTYGRNHALVAVALDNIGYTHFGLGQYGKAIPFHQRALKIREKALGKNHPNVATSALNLANAHFKQGDYKKAAPMYERARKIFERTNGRFDPQVAKTLGNLAAAHAAQGRMNEALTFSRKATGALTEARKRAVVSRGDTDDNLTLPLSNLYTQLVAIALDHSRKQKSKRAALADEALQAAQRHSATNVSAALSQMAARFGANDKALGKVVREQQDLTAKLQAVEKSLIAELAKAKSGRNPKTSAALRRDRKDTEKKLKALTARLDREFPNYSELIDPNPLSIKEIQKLLSEDEALVVYLFPKLDKATESKRPSERESYVWAITREALRWRELPKGLTEVSVADRVAGLRKRLQFESLQNNELFDLEKSHALYRDLLGPVEDLVATKKKLLIVPSAALTSLPFNTLVTAKPAEAIPQNVSGYRDAAWLIKRHAIAILPSVSSLRALRVFASKTRAKDAFIGYGNPDFGSGETGEVRGARVADIKTRSFASFYKAGGQVDLRLLSESLPPLPDTADELRHVAGKLGADAAQVRLGQSATEQDVKAADLENYRVVYFATHGLVAGDLEKLGSTAAEPALALTVPAKATEIDNGLLTASEVAQLKLNADWVVLSACNTAAGDKPGAEALSGLAKSFIYAGARALLVSHWPVASSAAVTLTSQIFDARAQDPDLGKAEALQRSMLALLQDDKDPLNAYPAVWAPFIVVGD